MDRNRNMLSGWHFTMKCRLLIIERFSGQAVFRWGRVRKEIRGNAFKNSSSNFLKIFLAKPRILATIATFSDAGWSSLVARRAHNPKVVGSNPAPATKFPFRTSSVCFLVSSLVLSLFVSHSFCAAAIPLNMFTVVSMALLNHPGIIYQVCCTARLTVFQFPAKRPHRHLHTEVQQALLPAASGEA